MRSSLALDDAATGAKGAPPERNVDRSLRHLGSARRASARAGRTTVRAFVVPWIGPPPTVSVIRSCGDGT
jgi:hypothetical protein